MSRLIKWMDRKLYPEYGDKWDDLLFQTQILNYLNSESIALDLGAGAGIIEYMNFKGLARHICGIDLDPRVIHNPYLDEGRIASADEIPFENDKFDLVFSDNVLEHLDNPLEVFCEVKRVLKPGGIFLFKTPNIWHYMPTIARLTPHTFHRFINRVRGRNDVDTFPTRYQANTKDRITKLAEQSGLQIVDINQIEGRPEYLRLSSLSYIFGFLYERVVNSVELFSNFRILLIGVLKKAD